jgi:hypothetical protein
MMEQAATCNQWFECLAVIDANKLMIYGTQDTTSSYNEMFIIEEGEAKVTVVQEGDEQWVFKITQKNKQTKRLALKDSKLVEEWKKYFKITM